MTRTQSIPFFRQRYGWPLAIAVTACTDRVVSAVETPATLIRRSEQVTLPASVDLPYTAVYRFSRNNP